MFPSLAVTDLAFGVHPAQEELAVVLDHLADARAFDNVGADPEDLHLSPLSVALTKRSARDRKPFSREGLDGNFSLPRGASGAKTRQGKTRQDKTRQDTRV
jgi:hypothetical protein